MKKVVILVVVFGGLLLVNLTKAQEDINIALQRGYKTGYSDGYMAGYRDASEGKEKNYQSHSDYQKADRAYKTEFGALEDYRDGYRRGFERGYADGFEKREFKPDVPVDLRKNSDEKRNGTTAWQNETVTSDSEHDEKGARIDTNQDGPIIVIPADTELIVELEQSLSTETNKAGDKFTAKVVSPSEIYGATIEGRINKLQKPGKIKRRAEMLLSFDIIRINERRWANYNAMVVEVLPLKGDNVKQVDDEGVLQGKSSLKDDAKKVAVSTGAGAVAGGVIGGPAGVAIGAGVGAAFGVGTIVTDRGKHIKLSKGQQLRIRTVYETQIR